MKKSLKEMVGAALASTALVASMGLVACGQNSSSTSTASTTTEEASSAAETSEAAAPGEAAGFTEIPIFEDQEVDFLNVSAVYFQAVPMAPAQEDVGKANIHLEADVSALKNDLGYEVGTWVPYMTVDYIVTDKSGKEVVSGTFMEMNASDGTHYGANVTMPEAGDYKLKFVFHSPADNGYLIHLGETGPGGTLEEHFKNGTLETKEMDWTYVPVEA
ncbi:MAG: iron transporter [Coriobacteriales bacterium]|nr:iron transporter [Coriobacteriales bacterium]